MFVYLLCTFFLWHKYTNFFIGQSIQILAVAIDISWFFVGMENFKVTVTRNILVKIISIFCIFTFIHNKNDTNLFIIINGISLFVGNITLFPYLKKYVDRPNFRTIKILKHLLPSMMLFIPQIAIQLYVVINKTLLGFMVSVNASGFYDNADKIVRLMLAITTAVGTVMLPHIANQFINGEHEKIKQSVYNSFDFVTFITVPLAFGLASVANKFSILFFGSTFKPVGDLLAIESIAAIFMSWAYAIGTQYLLPTKQTKQYTIAVTFGAVTNMMLNIPFITFWGTTGAMLTTIISEVCVTACMLFFIKRQLNLFKLFTNTPKYLLAALVMFLVAKFIGIHSGVNWWSVIIQVIIGIITYVAVILIVKPTILKKWNYY